MDDREFVELADTCLDRAAEWLEEFDPEELDYSTADGSVTIEFADGAKFILSRQSATRQLWLAAGAQGHHFDYDQASGSWLDDKDGGELFETLAAAIGEQLGREVEVL